MDAIAGGGGLITLPMILSLGGDPQVASAQTNCKPPSARRAPPALFQSRCGGTGRLLARLPVHLHRRDHRHIWRPANRPTHAQSHHSPLLIAVAVYSLRNPNLGERETKPLASRAIVLILTFGLALGFTTASSVPHRHVLDDGLCAGDGVQLTRAPATQGDELLQ